MSSKSVKWEPICPTHTDKRTDMTKLSVAFGNFAKVPKRDKLSLYRPRQNVIYQDIQSSHDGKIASPTRRPPLPPVYIPDTHFC
jgi:hypothetical protein